MVKKIKNTWNNISLFRKMVIIFMLVCLVPLLLFGTVLYTISARNLDESTIEFASAFGSQMVYSMNDFIKRNDQLTKSVLIDAETIRRLDDKERPISERIELQLELRHTFLRLLTLDSDIISVCVVTKNQNYYDIERYGATIDVDDLLRQQWMENALKDEEVFLVTPVHNRSYYYRNEDGIVVSMIRKLYSVNGYEGFLLVDMDPAALIKLSDDFVLARNNYNIKVAVSDKNGDLLYDSDLSSGRIQWSEIDQESLLVYEKNIEDYYIISDTTDRLNLVVNVVIPRSSMLLRISRLREVILILITILVIVVIALAIIVSGSITRPIGELQRGMADLEKGYYRLIEMNARSDEIGNLVIGYNHMIKKVKQLIENVYLAEIKQKNAKYLALQTQINPHMLFNTLESIRMKALMNGDDNTADMIKLLAKMFRTALNSDTEHHTVQDELEYAESYIALQNMRFRDLYSLETDVDKEFYEVELIPIVFQPIIENSIEHGIRDRSTPLHLSIRARSIEEKKLQFLITDDGKGMDQDRFERLKKELDDIGKEDTGKAISSQKVDAVKKTEKGHRSIGIVNIAERIKIRYGEEGDVCLVSSDDNGTCVEVVIPLE